MWTIMHYASGPICTASQVGRKPLLLWGSFALMTDTVAAATLILAFRLEVEDNKAVGYIVAALICIFNFVYTFTVGYVGTWYTYILL